MDEKMIFMVGFLAMFCEGMVEYFVGTLFDKVEALKAYRWTIIYIAAVFGALLAVLFKIDIFAVLLGGTPAIGGMILTGLILGRGSNYIHDLFSLIVSLKTPPNTTVHNNVSFPAKFPLSFDDKDIQKDIRDASARTK